MNFNKIIDGIGKDLDKFKPVHDISSKLGLKPGHIGLGIFGIIFFLVLSGIFGEFITSIFGFLYPAYMSCKALEHEESSSKSTEKWLTYWVVFSSLLLADISFGFFLQFIPFYYIFKLLLTMWLFYPKSNGAHVIYSKFIRPWLKSHEAQIDAISEKVNHIPLIGLDETVQRKF